MEINHNLDNGPVEVTVKKVNEGCEDEMNIAGYQKSHLRTCLLVILFLLSGGLIAIWLAWKSSNRLKTTHRPCKLNKAEKVLLKDNDGMEYVEKIESTTLQHQGKSREVSYFFNKKLKYVWDEETSQFYKVSGLTGCTDCSSFHEKSHGLTSDIAGTRLRFFGENTINVDVKSIPSLILEEAANPFYIFQVYTVILWTVQLYYQFAIGVAILAAISIFVAVFETRRQSIALRDAVHSVSKVTIIRDGEEVRKSSNKLVPGDVIVIPRRDFQLECDAVLVSGGCIVNESSLTGESIPVTKSSIPNDERLKFQESSHKKHILFCGTKVLQTRPVGDEAVRAVVLRTGFCTTKGELVRAILFPKPLELKFYSDFLKFFVVFIVLGFGAVIYSFVIWASHKAYVIEMVFLSLDILTFVVPPILPATYTSIAGLSQRRLKRHGIFCVSSKYINLCGGLDVMCFDKTGTLTEDSLDLTVVVPVKNARFLDAVQDPTHLEDSPLLQAMATCHNLSLIDEQLSGYPLDLKVFEAINWTLEEPKEVPDLGGEMCSPVVVFPKIHSSYDKSENKWIILKQYPFESGLQRMSVVARLADTKNYHVYVKGAPEKVASLCLPDTVPEKFSTILTHYTRLGFRVLAAAWKSLPKNQEWNQISKMSREEMEKDLEFGGLLVLQNLLKPETSPVLNILRKANIRNVMVTGDSLLTAISVAIDSEIIVEEDDVILIEAKELTTEGADSKQLNVTFNRYEHKKEKKFRPDKIMQECKVKLLPETQKFHFAMDGLTFGLIRSCNKDLLNRVVHHGTIFARMLPEQKIHLVETLQELGFQVGMCGDGANDCGALKVAHAGVSLCSAEASIASPFTSTKTNITCIPTLICEGRGSLTSCIGVFKYEVAYCFSMLFMALMLFWAAVRPSDPQYVYIDMILSIFPAIVFGCTGPCSYLSQRQPIRKLLDVTPLASIFSFLIIQLIFYVIAWEYCRSQPWFIPFEYVPGHWDSGKTYEGTVMFSISLFSYTMAVIVFSKGAPFRKEFYTNIPLTVFVVVSFIASSILIIHPGENLSNLLSIKTPPYIMYSVTLFGFAIINCLFSYFWEIFVIDNLVQTRLAPFLYNLRGPTLLHEQLARELQGSHDWPPNGNRTYPIQKNANDIVKRKGSKSVDVPDIPLHRMGEQNPPLIEVRRYSRDNPGSMANCWGTFCTLNPCDD